MKEVGRIIQQIEFTIENSKIGREEKIECLKILSERCWEKVFPELNTSEFDKLSSQEKSKRWKKVAEQVLLHNYSEHIFYVLDWPASGGNFFWVK